GRRFADSSSTAKSSAWPNMGPKRAAFGCRPQAPTSTPDLNSCSSAPGCRPNGRPRCDSGAEAGRAGAGKLGLPIGCSGRGPPLGAPRGKCFCAVALLPQWGDRMGGGRRNRAEAPSPWVRALVALVILGVGVYGVSCLIRGRLVTEGVVLEGLPARVVGALIAALAAISLARTLYPGGKR